jgi:hypothetical protein
VDATKLNDWMQVIGIFAVVASLIFVGLEMRQAQEISMSQTYQSRTSAVVEWDSAFAANHDALSAQWKASNGAADEITTEEYEALRFTLLGLFHLYDNAHYQYQKGFVSQEFWEITRESMKSQMMNPVTNAIFLEKLDRGVRPDFRYVVIKIDKELGK